MKNGVLSNFTRSHISSDRVRSGYEIRSKSEAAIAHVCGPVYDVSCLYHVLWSIAWSLIFSILHVVVLEKLWTFVLGTKQSVRITSIQIHSLGSCIYLVHFSVCREPGLAEPETLKLGCSKWTKLSQYVSSWMFGFKTGCIKVKVLSEN